MPGTVDTKTIVKWFPTSTSFQFSRVGHLQGGEGAVQVLGKEKDTSMKLEGDLSSDPISNS